MANCCDLEENTFTPKLFLAKLEDLLIAGWGVMGGSGQILAKLLTGLLLSCLSENSLNKSICWPPTNIGHDPTVQQKQQKGKVFFFSIDIFLRNDIFLLWWKSHEEVGESGEEASVEVDEEEDIVWELKLGRWSSLD